MTRFTAALHMGQRTVGRPPGPSTSVRLQVTHKSECWHSKKAVDTSLSQQMMHRLVE